MSHKTIALSLAALCVVLAVVVVVMGVTMAGWGGGEQPAPAAEGGAPSPAAADGGTLPVSAATEEPSVTPGQASTPEPTATPVPTEEPWAGPDVPAQSDPAGSSYFADAGFLGNSVLSGLWYYDYDGLLPDDSFFWTNGLTILGASPYAAQMTGFGKIYVGFGMNELSYEKSTLRQAYNTVLDQLEENNPGCIIYLVSVSPVSLWKSTNDRYITRELVQSFNEMLRQIAQERQVWYLDVYNVLCDADGYLPSDVTNDGVHFTPAHYELWFDYMNTHYIPDGTEAPPAEATVPPEEQP